MSQQYGIDEIRANHRGIVRFYGRVVFTTSGAVDSVDMPGATVTKPSGTGLYRITFDDPFLELMHASATILDAATSGRGITLQVAVDYTAKVVDVLHVDASGAAADATSGDVWLLTVDVRARQ